MLISSLKRTARKGFSLIELALIIAIIGILTAIVANQFVDMTGKAEKAFLQEYNQKIENAISNYIASQESQPTDFTFVSPYGTPPNALATPPSFIGLPLLRGDKQVCTKTLTVITCDNAELKKWTATYTLSNGSINMAISPQ